MKQAAKAKRRYPSKVKPKRKDGTPEIASLVRWTNLDEKDHVLAAAQSLDTSLSMFAREAALERANQILKSPLPASTPA
jgi:hypothetical protein